MPSGLPSYPQSTFPHEKAPTLFSPAAPKDTKTTETDAASMASVSTLASTVSLIKSKFHTPSYKGYKAKKETKIAARSTVVTSLDAPSKKREPLKDTRSARARTMEAYMVHAIMR